jgi:hypothetical protein
MAIRAAWVGWPLVVALLMTTPVMPAARSIVVSDGTYRISLWRMRAPAGSALPRDVVLGVVGQGPERGSEAIYEGLVRRATDELGAVELIPPLVSERACRGMISGAGDVHVRIKVFPPADNRPAWIVITPIDVMAWATGPCPSSDLRALERAYAERITLEIPLPGGRLTPGRFDGEPDASGGRWRLYVHDPLAVVRAPGARRDLD